MAEPEQEENNEPEELELWLQLQAWAEKRKRELRLGGIGLVVAIFVGYTATHLASRKEAQANAALFSLEKFSETERAGAGDYLKVATDYNGTSAAERALYLGAGVLFDENKYPEAQQRFEEYVRQYPESPWANGARYGVAAALDAQNKTAEALAAYEALITQAVGSTEANLAKLSAALIHEQQGKPEQALKYYDELIRAGEAEAATWAPEARVRKEDLLRKFPQITPAGGETSAAAAPATAPLVLQADAADNSTTNAAATNSPAK